MLKLTSLTFILLSSIISELIIEISSQDYCNLESCSDGSHTKCKFGSEIPELCGVSSMIQSGVSAEQQQEILDIHNIKRSYVASGQEKRGSNGAQPAAINLGPLSWDDEIASIAQTWADQCKFGHDDCRNVERFGVGQNIVSSSATDQFPNNLTSLVLTWYEEVVDFDSNLVGALGDTPALHYTQMVWAGSEYLGCGLTKYFKDDWYTTYLVCNYGPSGNVIGFPVYEVQ